MRDAGNLDKNKSDLQTQGVGYNFKVIVFRKKLQLKQSFKQKENYQNLVRDKQSSSYITPKQKCNCSDCCIRVFCMLYQKFIP